MLYYYICSAMLILFFVCLISVLIEEYKSKNLTIYKIAFSILLVLLFKYDWGVHFFGLEYEDAYIFSGCARMFTHSIYTHSFLTDCISVGSFENPIILSTYGGHFINYSVYLSAFIGLFDYSPEILVIANTVLSFFIMLILSLCWTKNKWLWVVAPLLYCCAPIINVFSTTFLSELFSSFICLTYIFYIGKFIRNKRLQYFFLSVFAFLMALMCKRENLILMVFPIAIYFFEYLQIKKIDKEYIKSIALHLFMCAVYFLFIQNVFNIEVLESKDIGTSTFSISNFITLSPYFAKGYFNIKHFTVVGYIFLISLMFCFKRNRFTIIFPLLFVFIGYFLLYSSHYRGYFFSTYGDVSMFETFRYVNNFYYIIPLIVSSILYKNFGAKSIRVILSFIVICALCSAFITFNLRKKYSKIEFESRFANTQIIMEEMNKNDSICLLITDKILVYQNLYQSDLLLYDITHYDKDFLVSQKLPVYIEVSNEEYLCRRYNISLDSMNLEPIIILADDHILYKYSSAE